MKILKLTVRFPPAPGGVEFQQHAICKELLKRGHDVEVFSSDLYSEIPWKKLDGGYTEVEGVSVRRFRAYSLKGDLQYSIMPNMLRAVLSGKWDIIHAHSYGFFPSHAGALAGRAGRGNFVFTPHLHPGKTTWGGLIRRQLRALYDRYFAGEVNKVAAKIICVSKGEMEYAIESGFDRNKMVIVSDSVDLTRFEGKEKGAFKKTYGIDSDFVLFVGRLAKNKGLDFFIKAAPKILAKYPEIKFVFIGEDEGMKEGLLLQAKIFGIEQSILFTGALEYDMVTSAFLDCNIFVLPSEYEAFGIVAAEAQAAKKPVVATRVGGVPNVVRDKETGLLVDYGNSEDLAKGICKLLEDENKRRNFGEAGYEWVKHNFDIKNVVDDLEKVYQEVVE